jgi:hypothetical protein
VEGHSGGDLHGEDPCDNKVDSGTERGPPPGIGDIVRSFLPEVFATVRGVANHEKPWRCRDTDCGQDQECPGNAALHRDDLWSTVADGEADIDGGDEADIQRVHGRLVEPSHRDGRCGLNAAHHDTPHNGGERPAARMGVSHRAAIHMSSFGCELWGSRGNPHDVKPARDVSGYDNVGDGGTGDVGGVENHDLGFVGCSLVNDPYEPATIGMT